MGNMCSCDPDISSTHQLHSKDAPSPLPRLVGGFVLKETTNEKSFLPTEPKDCGSTPPGYATDEAQPTHPPTPRSSAVFDDMTLTANDPPGYATDEAQPSHPTTPQPARSPPKRRATHDSTHDSNMATSSETNDCATHAAPKTHPPTPRRSAAFDDVPSSASPMQLTERPLLMVNEDTETPQMHGLRKSETELAEAVRENKESFIKLQAKLSESSERQKHRLLRPRSASLSPARQSASLSPRRQSSSPSLSPRRQQSPDQCLDTVAMLKDVGVDAAALWNRAVAAGLEMPSTCPPQPPLAIPTN